MPTDWNILQSKAIDALRFPMAVAVVVLHYSKTLILDASGPLRVLCILFQEGLCRLAVPCFFFISGYLFFTKLHSWDWSVWKTKIRRRLKSLLIPYLLWNILAFLAYWGYAALQEGGVPFSQEFAKYGGIRMFLSTGGGIPISSQAFPVNGPLWFIRDLMYFVLLTPLIYGFLRITRVYGVLGLCLVFLAVRRIVPEGFLFFTIGSWMQLSGRNIVKTLAPAGKWLIPLSVILLAATCLLTDVSDYWSRFSKFFFISAGIAASFHTAASLEQNDRVHLSPFLVGSSFFIFAAHEVLILQNISIPLVNAILPSGGDFWPCVAFFLVPALAVGICLMLLRAMQKFLPRTTALLTGGRKSQPALTQ